MFKKTKEVELKPPEPPSFAQIMEDMETFLVEKPPIERIRSLPSSSLTDHERTNESSNSIKSSDLENWWKVFESFQADNEDLQCIRRKLITCKKQLDEKKNEIKETIDVIQLEIDMALKDPPIELP